MICLQTSFIRKHVYVCFYQKRGSGLGAVVDQSFRPQNISYVSVWVLYNKSPLKNDYADSYEGSLLTFEKKYLHTEKIEESQKKEYVG